MQRPLVGIQEVVEAMHKKKIASVDASQEVMFWEPKNLAIAFRTSVFIGEVKKLTRYDTAPTKASHKMPQCIKRNY